MDYHSDRFVDYSLIIYDKDKTVAILPAHIIKNELVSHNGLTYGEIVFANNKLLEIVEIFSSVLEYLNNNKIETLSLKLIPRMYFDKPSDELHYALFLSEARLTQRLALSVIDRSAEFKMSRHRKQTITRAIKNNLRIEEVQEFSDFWNEILIPNLRLKHNVKPVHSLEEIEHLHKMFPENIRQFNVYHNDKIIAGTTVFITKNVIHPQYISGNSDKNELGSIDFLYDYLINDVFKEVRYFDFGPSHEQAATKVNSGILFWKETFGTGTMTQDFYEVKTANYKLLQNIAL